MRSGAIKFAVICSGSAGTVTSAMTASPRAPSRAARSGAPPESRRALRENGGSGPPARRSCRSVATGRRPSRLRLLALLLPRGRHLIEAARLLERGILVLLPNGAVDLFTVDAHLRRSLDSEPDLIPLHLEHSHGDGITDAN